MDLLLYQVKLFFYKSSKLICLTFSLTTITFRVNLSTLLKALTIALIHLSHAEHFQNCRLDKEINK